MDNQEKTKAEPAGETKPGYNWNRRDVFFIIAPIICIIFVSFGGFDYLCGRFNLIFYSLLSCMFYPAIFLLFLFLEVVNVMRLFVPYRKHTLKKKIIILAGLIAPIMLCVLFVIFYYSPIELKLKGPGYKSFTSGFGDWIKSKADIPVIRGWLKTLEQEDYSSDNIITLQKNYPESLMVLRPSVINVSADENGNAKASLYWGSSYAGNWGAVIGMENMKTPPSDFMPYGDYRYRLPLEPGVYVWHDL